MTVSNLILDHQVSVSMIFAIFHKEMGLVKKSARWVPKFLSQDQKEERVRTCSNFAATIRRESMAFLARIFTMDKPMVSFHTPGNKRMINQCTKKDSQAQLRQGCMRAT